MTATSPGVSLLNFRDVGGLRTTQGGTVRSGLLFRSDDPGALGSTSWAALQTERGLATAIDLRSDFENSIMGESDDTGRASLHRVPIIGGSMMEAASRGGVERSAVIDDYARSTSGPEMYERARARSNGPMPTFPPALLEAPSEAITIAPDGIDERYGSSRKYLASHGVDEACFTKLERQLVG